MLLLLVMQLNMMRRTFLKKKPQFLICLQRINDKRISDSKETNKRRKLDDDSSSCSGGRSSSSSSNCGGGSSARRELNGVLAEEKITAFEMWMEIAMFL